MPVPSNAKYITFLSRGRITISERYKILYRPSDRAVASPRKLYDHAGSPVTVSTALGNYHILVFRTQRVHHCNITSTAMADHIAASFIKIYLQVVYSQHKVQRSNDLCCCRMVVLANIFPR